MQRRRGCGLVAWVVVLAAVLAVAAFLVHKAQVEELRRQQEEQLERRAVRATQMDQIGTNLVKALKAAEEGDISSALLILESQGEILAAVAKEAAASHDAEDATGAADKKSALAQAASGIRQKQEETRAFAVRQISGLAVQFPQVREASTKAAAEGTEAGATPQPETPAGGEGAEATPAPEAPAPTGEGQAAPAPAPGAGP